MPRTGALVDRYGRVHNTIRVSVTDRCNYRCTYCMPAEGLSWLRREDLLTYEEIHAILTVLAGMGVAHVRLTGGEPTLRRGLVGLVRNLCAIEGIDQVSMTTNGHAFGPHAGAFAEAGLARINVSLDTLDEDHFRTITRGGDLKRVLRSIDAAIAHGITPVKINAVVMRGENDHDVAGLIEHFAPLAEHVVVRFIEFMPFEGTRGSWKAHVPSAELRSRLSERWTLIPAGASRTGPANNWRVAETGQTVGFISPITEHFCDRCNRLRLSAEGHLRTCLSREPAPSLRDLIRSGVRGDELAMVLRARLWNKVAGHEAHLGDQSKPFEGVMTQIGG
jgi:GTP 3',8-cyclase